MQVLKSNTNTINEYLKALEIEVNPSRSYRMIITGALNYLSQFHKGKPYSRMRRDDIVSFLSSLKKPNDPSHKWIGTYNLYLKCIIKFFKWLHSPNLEPKQRLKPQIVQNIPDLKRKEISYEDRWKVYVELRDSEQRQLEGSAITNLTLDTSSIDFVLQELTLMGGAGFGQFLDFSIGYHVTVSDGNPNLGSNPTASIINIDLNRRSIRLRFYKGDLYYLILEGREKSTFTIDRFNFSDGMISMKFLDNFFRCSPYADVILQYWNSMFKHTRIDNNDTDNGGAN